jgi:hypothetical protein
MATDNLYHWKHINVQNKTREMFHFTDTVTHHIQSWRKRDFNRDISTLALNRVNQQGWTWVVIALCDRVRCAVAGVIALLCCCVPCLQCIGSPTAPLQPPARRKRGINSGLITRFESRDVHCWGILLSDIKEWLTSTTQTMRRATYLLFAQQKFAGSIPIYRTQNIPCTGNNSETSDVL